MNSDASVSLGSSLVRGVFTVFCSLSQFFTLAGFSIEFSFDNEAPNGASKRSLFERFTVINRKFNVNVTKG